MDWSINRIIKKFKNSYWILLQIVYNDLTWVEEWNHKVKCEIYFCETLTKW
jgi:hypothetical protein